MDGRGLQELPQDVHGTLTQRAFWVLSVVPKLFRYVRGSETIREMQQYCDRLLMETHTIISKVYKNSLLTETDFFCSLLGAICPFVS